MGEERDSPWTVFVDEALETVTDVAEGFVPARIAKDTFAALTSSDLGVGESVGVFVHSDTSDTPWTKSASIHRVDRVTSYMKQLAMFPYLERGAAFPETHTTNRVDLPCRIGRVMARMLAARRFSLCIGIGQSGGCRGACGSDLEEISTCICAHVNSPDPSTVVGLSCRQVVVVGD